MMVQVNKRMSGYILLCVLTWNRPWRKNREGRIHVSTVDRTSTRLLVSHTRNAPTANGNRSSCTHGGWIMLVMRIIIIIIIALGREEPTARGKRNQQPMNVCTTNFVAKD